MPNQADQLRSVVAGAATGTTILLHDGYYAMDQGDATSRLIFTVDGVTLRSLSGNRGAVVLDGAYATDELVSIQASDVVIASITLTRAYNHPIHISGGSGPIDGVVLHDLHVVDAGEQAIKINPVGEGWVDDGVVECSFIELTDAGRPHIRNNCYTGGVDAHAAQGWWIRRNSFRGFWCPAGLSEHAVHFWKGSRDTVVEENLILDCGRGIGLGLGQSGDGRSYPDNPYPGVGYLGHIDGVVRNNFIAAADAGLFGSAAGFDAGITLDQARMPLVVHNTVASTTAPFSSIEWRFGNTLIDLANNLVTHNLRPRDGAQAILTGNLEGAPLQYFADVASADLHLVTGDEMPVGMGSALPAGQADFDFDGHTRGVPRDVGADEWSEALFADGFESGDTTAW
ncbi:MAG: hypothetical protein K8J08_12060 [Thermoanaerobaculia bacterium]|nr:hypothetical protein [Thermoanaerobaculia bacterium]